MQQKDGDNPFTLQRMYIGAAGGKQIKRFLMSSKYVFDTDSFLKEVVKERERIRKSPIYSIPSGTCSSPKPTFSRYKRVTSCLFAQVTV
jgi:hypothetical protein